MFAAPQPTVYPGQIPDGLVVWRYAGNEYEADTSEFSRVFYQPDKSAFTVEVDGQQAWVPVAGLDRMSLVKLVRVAEYLHGDTPALYPPDLLRYFDPKPKVQRNQGQYRIPGKTDWMPQDALVDWLLAELEAKGDRPDDPYFDFLEQVVGVQVEARTGQMVTTYALFDNGRQLTDWGRRDDILTYAVTTWNEVAIFDLYQSLGPSKGIAFWAAFKQFLQYLDIDSDLLLTFLQNDA